MPITDAHATRLLTDGFCHLPGALPPPLLNRLQTFATTIEADALEGHTAGRPVPGACVIEDPVGPRLMRHDDLLRLDPDLCLDVLACPAMLAIAERLCGPGAVPLQMDLVYKQQHPHPIILWHQGAPHPRGFPYLNIGLHLDDAGPDDGCLHYVPGTQHGLVDIDAFARTHGWSPPDLVKMPTRAGDILVQDMMILHGSPPKRSPGVRRTVYVEMRPVAGIRESARQSEHWLELRRRWMALVVERAGIDWPDDLPPSGGTASAVSAILEHHEPPIPAVWGIEQVQTDDYPIPRPT